MQKQATIKDESPYAAHHSGKIIHNKRIEDEIKKEPKPWSVNGSLNGE